MSAVLRKKKKPKGQAVDLPEADDVQEAIPTKKDQQRAAVMVRTSALIAAIWSGIVIWNVTEQKFVNPRGGFISNDVLRQEWEKIITVARNEMRIFADDLLLGSKSIADWQFAMRDTLEPLHYITWSLGQGGPDHVSPANLKQLAEVIQGQVQFLNKRAGKIETQALDGTIRSTSGLYANAARSTYFTSVTDGAQARRIEYMERVLNPGESCADCIEWQGVWLIDEFPPISSSICGHNCNCDAVPVEELGPGVELNSD